MIIILLHTHQQLQICLKMSHFDILNMFDVWKERFYFVLALKTDVTSPFIQQDLYFCNEIGMGNPFGKKFIISFIHYIDILWKIMKKKCSHLLIYFPYILYSASLLNNLFPHCGGSFQPGSIILWVALGQT